MATHDAQGQSRQPRRHFAAREWKRTRHCHYRLCRVFPRRALRTRRAHRVLTTSPSADLEGLVALMTGGRARESDARRRRAGKPRRGCRADRPKSALLEASSGDQAVGRTRAATLTADLANGAVLAGNCRACFMVLRAPISSSMQACINIRKPMLEVTRADWDAILATYPRRHSFSGVGAGNDCEGVGRTRRHCSQCAFPMGEPYGASKGGIAQLRAKGLSRHGATRVRDSRGSCNRTDRACCATRARREDGRR